MLTRMSNDESTLRLQLAYRPPLAWPELINFLCQRGAPCLEQCVDQHYVRTIACGTARGWLAVTPAHTEDALQVTAAPALAATLPQLRQDLRRLFDLDANTKDIAAHLRQDPRLAPLIAQTPGLRIPGTMAGFELALRAILGQQITVKAATTVFTRFADFFGAPIATPYAGLNRLTPTAETLANANLQQIIDRGLPRRRAETIQGLATAIADGTLRLDASQPPADTRAALQALPGIGPWTAAYISLRALGDADAFPASDLGLLRRFDLASARKMESVAERWRPWRAYAAMYIWHSHGAGG